MERRPGPGVHLIWSVRLFKDWQQYSFYRAALFSATVSNWGDLAPENKMPWIIERLMNGYPKHAIHCYQ